jgi:acetoin utilization protein AcuC
MNESTTGVLVFSDRFNRFSYGPTHPLKIERLQLTVDLMAAYGLLHSSDPPWVEAREAEQQDLLLVHSPQYLEMLENANQGRTPALAWQYGLGTGDNPVFPGLYDWSRLVTGATLECIRQVRDGDHLIAFNIAGGLHHARRDRASGFCYLNDPAIGIAQLLQQGLRVAYVDVDVHHGDGVEAAFYHTDRVLTISLHQHGHTLFPGTGFPDEMGDGAGRGYAVNLPLAPGTDDELYLWVFMEVVPALVHAFSPDVLVSQMGVDTLATDPLGALNLTTNGFCRIVEEMKSWGYTWVALGGGGYRPANVARCWTSALAIMKGVDLPDALPDAFVRKHSRELGRHLTLSDPPHKADGMADEKARGLAEEVVAWIKEHVFPLVGV